MNEGCRDGVDCDALKHLVANWMVSCIISVKLLQGCTKAPGTRLSKVPSLAACFHKVRESEGKGQRRG